MLKKLQSSNILLIVGCILLLIGYFGPMIAQNHISLNEDIVLEAPYDPELLELSKPIIEALDGSASDGKALAKLYRDIAILISLNEDIIRTTEEIREANKLSGLMLQLNLKDKYPNDMEFGREARKLNIDGSLAELIKQTPNDLELGKVLRKKI